MNNTANIAATYGGVSLTASITVYHGMSGGTTYQYQVNDIPDNNAQVTDLKLTDIYMPKTMKTSWTSTYTVNPVYEVRRGVMSLGTTSNTYWSDAFPFISGQPYQYSVRINSGWETLG